MSELYRDFIDRKTNDIINILDGVITPTATAELYRDFINIKANDVITALNGTITPPPSGGELYRDFLNRKFNDVIAGIGSYIPPVSFPTVSGSIVTFNSQHAGLPLKSHTVAVTATQSGSGTPSPSNPRPITGYSAINISHSDADTSTPTVYTIQIGSTVYGGEYDARTGVLTVTHGYYDLGNIDSWNYYTSGTNPIFYSEIPLDGKIYNANEDIDCICSEYNPYPTAISRANLARFLIDKQFGFIYGNRNIVIRDDDYTDEISFKTAMSGVYICYELATPTTIQLPPCPIDTLEGVNNIWADTGETTLQYIKIGGNT